MATIDDVQAALVGVLGGLLFSGQGYLPGAVATASTAAAGAVPARLFMASPGFNALDEDIRSGVSNVVVTRNKGFSRDTTRFTPYYRQTSNFTPSIGAALIPTGVVFGGTPGPNQIVSVQVAGVSYCYGALATDGPAQIAAAFATQIGGGATAAGAVLTVTRPEAVNVACSQFMQWVTGTQEELVQIAILATATESATGPLVRQGLGAMVDGLRSLGAASGALTRFIALADGSHARVLAHDSIDDDTPRREDVWRRWYGYRVEYDNAVSLVTPPMLAPLVLGTVNASSIQWFGPGSPVGSVLTNGEGDLISNGGSGIMGIF